MFSSDCVSMRTNTCVTLFVIEGGSDDAMEIIANCLKDSWHAKTLTSQCHFLEKFKVEHKGKHDEQHFYIRENSSN